MAYPISVQISSLCRKYTPSQNGCNQNNVIMVKPARVSSSNILMNVLDIQENKKIPVRTTNCNYRCSQRSLIFWLLKSVRCIPTTHVNDALIAKNFVPSVLLSNVISLTPKIDKVACVVRQNQYDMVAIIETWLKDSIPDSSVHIKRYQLFSRYSFIWSLQQSSWRVMGNATAETTPSWFFERNPWRPLSSSRC